MASDVYVGVLKATIVVPGARSLKDRRQPLRAMRDRIRSRFNVTFNELGSEHPGQQGIVCTTAGNDASQVRQVMEDVRNFLQMAPDAYPAMIDVDVFSWHPEPLWTDDPDDEEFGDG